MPIPLRALLLDFGGTLASERRPRAVLYAQVARAQGFEVDSARVAEAMQAAHAALPRELDGAYRYSDPWFRAFIEHVFHRSLGFSGDLAELSRALFAAFSDARNFTLFPDAADLLDRARGLRPGLKVALVSNWGEHLAPLLAGLGVTGLGGVVDAQLSSALERVEKPDPELFRRALALLGVEAQQALHVGDRLDTDVLGATAAGIEAVLLDRSGRMCAPPGVRVVRSLTELDLP